MPYVSLSLIWLLFFLCLPISGPADLEFATPALADDDDDGGGDDDDDDDGPRRDRGSRRVSPRILAPAPRVAAPAPTTMPGEIVVAAITDDELGSIVADGFVVLASSPLLLIDGVVARLRPPRGLGVAAARDRIHLIAPAAIVEANHLYRPVEMPCRDNDCLAFEMIGWAVPPARCVVGEAVGMIDTAINSDHEALRGQSLEIVSVMSDDDRSSAAVHGTAIAALLIGNGESRTPGLLPDGQVIAVEAFHRDRAGDAADVYKIVRGLDQLRQRGVRVVNLSFAGPANALLERAVGAAVGGGALLVAAAGNRGADAPPAHPAAYPGVIAVTAVDKSNRPYRHAGRGDHIAFSAPGVGVWTAASVSGGRFRSGTSYAVPFVSAVIAATLARAPDQAATDMLTGLAAQSLDLGEAGRDPVFGWGLVKAAGC